MPTMVEWNEVEEFCRCLQSSAGVFRESILLTALPDHTLSPLSEFTGRIPGRVVIVSPGESQAEELTPRRVVSTSQPLSHKRQFLCQTESLYSGQRGATEAVYSAGCFPPLSRDRARWLLSLFAVGCSSGLVAGACSVWAYCEGGPLAVLGCAHDAGTLRCYHVKLEGVLSEEQVQSTMAEKIAKPLCSVYSEYAITEDDPSSAGHLTVQFGWADADSWLSPPPESADAVLKLSVKPGSAMSPVLANYQELCTLLHLCRLERGTAVWEEGGGQRNLLAPKLPSFLEDLSSPSLHQVSVAVVSPTAELAIYKQREDLDFVEQLWNFAKDVQSMEDLQELMAGVFKAVLLGKVEPFIHKGSRCMLAVLFRQVLLSGSPDERQALAPRFQALLSPSSLLPCLAELGFEKLLRDYRCFFVGSDVLSVQFFDGFIKEFSRESAGLLEQCDVLWRLHTALELTATLLVFLNLPPSTLSPFARTALREVGPSPQEGAEPVFTLPLPAYSPSLKSVAALSSKLRPQLWTACDHPSSMALFRRSPLNAPRTDTAASYWHYTASCVTVI